MQKYKPYFSCCIPHCDSTGPSETFIHFPADPDVLQQWLVAIPRPDWVADHYTLICSKHFQPSEIFTNFTTGQLTLVDSNTIPKIFDDIPAALFSTPNYTPSYMFEVPSRDCGPEIVDEKLEDFILNYYFLLLHYPDRIGSLIKDGKWSVAEQENALTFYQLEEEIVGLVKVYCSVKIDVNLIVKIALTGHLMDPLDLTRYLPASGRITRWSQLQLILFDFVKRK